LLELSPIKTLQLPTVLNTELALELKSICASNTCCSTPGLLIALATLQGCADGQKLLMLFIAVLTQGTEKLLFPEKTDIDGSVVSASPSQLLFMVAIILY
jgi:hypothetical protein